MNCSTRYEQQVGAGRFDQVHERQPVLERDRLRALQLLQAHRLQRAGVDAGVVGDEHDAHAGDDADAGDDAAAGHRASRDRRCRAASRRASRARGRARRGRAGGRRARAAGAGRAWRTAARRARSPPGCAPRSRASARSGRGVRERLRCARFARRRRAPAAAPASAAPPSARRASRRDGSRRRPRSCRRCRPRARSASRSAPRRRRAGRLPETKAAAGESRKTIAAATSLSVPSRRSGTSACRPRKVLGHLGRVAVEAARGDPARRDRVDAHRRPLERRRLGEVEHAGARRARVAHARHAVPHVGDDVDDRAAARRAVAVVLEHPLGDALARHQEAAGEVVAHHRVPALGADRRERRRELAAGVVHQRVDAAVGARAPPPPSPAPRPRRGCRRHATSRCRRRPRSRRCTASSLSSVRPTIATRGAERRQLVRGAAADARAAAGDEGDLAGEQVGRGRRSGRRASEGKDGRSTKRLLGG